MSQAFVTVATGARHRLDRAALTVLIASLPGLLVRPLESYPPPRVLVWDPGSWPPDGLPSLGPATAPLLVVGEIKASALPTGVAGLFSKDETPEAFGIAIRQVARGEQYLSPSLALALLHTQDFGAPSPAIDPSTLPAREQEILTLLAQGLSNKAIGARLYLSVRTVEGHLANLYAHLGVHSRTEAVLLAIRRGSASPLR